MLLAVSEGEVLLGEQEGVAERKVPQGEAEGEAPLGEQGHRQHYQTMDYLLSLVGKDQDTITDAIKELAENGERVKLQEKEIEKLHDDIDESKEEVHYLRNKLENKRDIIDDLENEIDKKDDEYKKIKKDFEMKEEEYENLEKFVTERVEEINILRENNESIISQISENIRMERKIGVQESVIKELKDKLKHTNDIKIEVHINERDRLFKEVESLKKENADKEFALKSLDNECSDLKEKLDNFEKEQTSLTILKMSKSLDEEIKEVEKNVFKCEECKHIFEYKSELKLHMRNMHELVLWKSKLMEIETENAKLKYKLSLDLFRIKELELKNKESCSCRGFCAISHSKHNWKKISI